MLRPISGAQFRPWCNTDRVTEMCAQLKAEREASPLDDDDFPRECEVCGFTPRPQSLYCSPEHEAMVEDDDDPYQDDPRTLYRSKSDPRD